MGLDSGDLRPRKEISKYYLTIAETKRNKKEEITFSIRKEEKKLLGLVEEGWSVGQEILVAPNAPMMSIESKLGSLLRAHIKDADDYCWQMISPIHPFEMARQLKDEASARIRLCSSWAMHSTLPLPS